MKFFIPLFIVLLFAINTGAQTNTFPTSGNTGIGTLAPDSKLHVIGDIHHSGTIGGNGSYSNVIKIPPLSNSPAYFYINTNIQASDNFAPQLQVTGYMYHSTNKAMKITIGWYHYQNSIYWSQYQSDLGYQRPSRVRLGKYTKGDGNVYIRIEISNNSVYWANYTISATDISDNIAAYSGWTYAEGEMPTATTSEIIEVQQQPNVVIDGNLGIGTTSSSEKLTVNGKIKAKEIRVEPTGWSDYVFDEDYKLNTLEEIETFIKKNKHLPEIPSAKEVATNGIELGELNKLLLKKVEELTLYLIQNKHTVFNQNNQIKDQEERIKKLEAALSLLLNK